MVVAVFNGASLRQLLSSPSTIDAMVAKAFASQDAGGRGKLRKEQLLPVLQSIAPEQGMPPAEGTSLVLRGAREARNGDRAG